LTPSATILSASMSRPESVSSSTARRGSSTAICKISLRFFSPPEKPTLSARHFHRILERQEHALGGALVRRHAEDAGAVEQHVAFGDFVIVLAGQHIG